MTAPALTLVADPLVLDRRAQDGDAATASGVVGDGVLPLLAEAPDEAGAAFVERVLGDHSLRFATHDERTVSWERS